MRKILIFFFFVINIFSLDLEIMTKEQISFEKDILEYKILQSPRNAKFNINKISLNSFDVTLFTEGSYIISFSDINGNIIEKNFYAKSKEYTSKEIEDLFKSKNIYDSVTEIYLKSKDNLKSLNLIYKFLLDKSFEKNNIDYILNVFSTSKKFIKNFRKDQEKFLEQLFLNKKELGEIRAEVLTLSFLKDYNSYYLFLYGKYALETGFDEEKGRLILEKLVDESLDMEAAKILGTYYLNRNDNKCEKYLFMSDKKAFFMHLLSTKTSDEFDYYFDKLNSDEKEIIKAYKEEYDKSKLVKLYLQKGNLNVKQNRLELAKEYFYKVSEFSTDNSEIKEALFNLGKIAVLEENYAKGLEIFDAYFQKYDNIDEVEALYYLGLCNFKLKNIEKSDIIFNRIKKTYKYSIWDEKIKILLKEI